MQQGPGLKLANKFLGPYTIIKQMRNNRYLVRRVGEHEGPLQTSTAADYMKPWISEEEDYRLVSLDAILLLTNIPKKMVIKTLLSIRWILLQQLDGSSNGNPVSPILANLEMDHTLKKIKGNLPFRGLFLKVYVDDIKTAIPKDGLEVVLKTFNMINEKIQFTIEIEDNGTLQFLDVTVIRNEDRTISTNGCVKPTSSGRCINYYLNHPLSQKIGTIKRITI
ncbi:hypothetical protein M0804_013516 [Polistes exclamans]|nr:hypothetical protein M0804_013516 [Polistes exclamans]